MTLLISSIAPALFIMYVIYSRDLQKEPKSMLIKAFFGGVLSIFISLLISMPLAEYESSIPSGFMRSGALVILNRDKSEIRYQIPS